MSHAPAAHVELISSTDSCEFVDEWYGMAGGDHFWMRWRFAVLCRVLRKLGLGGRSDLRALDVGGGGGVVRAAIERTFPFDVDCADLNMRALQGAPSGRGRTLFYDILDRHRAHVGAYDLILLLDVLEHIEPTRPFVEALVEHLSPTGIVVVNVPALQWARSRYDDVVGHHRRYTRRTLREEFEPLGLRVLDARYWGMSLLPVLFARAAMLRFVREDRVVSSGFEPPSRWVNAAMTGLMRCETSLLPAPPLGTSVLASFGR